MGGGVAWESCTSSGHRQNEGQGTEIRSWLQERRQWRDDEYWERERKGATDGGMEPGEEDLVGKAVISPIVSSGSQVSASQRNFRPVLNLSLLPHGQPSALQEATLQRHSIQGGGFLACPVCPAGMQTFFKLQDIPGTGSLGWC